MIVLAFNAHDSKTLAESPETLRGFVTACQQFIDSFVASLCPGAVATSGFRCPACNKTAGGHPLSRHLWGLARDYRRSTVDVALLQSRCPKSLVVVDEPSRGSHGVVHVAYR